MSTAFSVTQLGRRLIHFGELCEDLRTWAGGGSSETAASPEPPPECQQ